MAPEVDAPSTTTTNIKTDSAPSIALKRAATIVGSSTPDTKAPAGGPNHTTIPITPVIRTRDANSRLERHYVIIVHGTFDAPPENEKVPRWYEPDPENDKNFCTLLGNFLQKSPLEKEAVWRDLPMRAPPKLRTFCCGFIPAEPEVVVPYPFYWDGSNTHAGRIAGGRQLAVLINTIGKNDPAARIHLVAHSHGGNVVLAAIAKYLRTLRKEADDTYEDAISQSFWMEEREEFEEISKPGKVDDVKWWWKLNPLCMVHRPFPIIEKMDEETAFKKAKISAGKLARASWMKRILRPSSYDQENFGGRELYRWAYYSWMDRLLQLGRIRRYEYLRRRWATSPITNALGNIVFLGTPFYTKIWDDFATLYLAMAILWQTIVIMITVGVIVTLVRLAIYHRYSSLLGTGSTVFWAVNGALTVVALTIKRVQDRVFYNGNLYHDPRLPWSRAMRALVVHAGKLDEAALALSTEPVVRAYLLPQIRFYLDPAPWSTWQYPIGRTWYKTLAIWYDDIWLIVWNTLFSLLLLLRWAFNFVLVPLLSEGTLKILIEMSFGLQNGELENAHIYAGERLELPSNTHKYQHWNVQQLFAAEESFAPFIEAVEEAAGSDDPDEQEAAEHAATVVAENAPAAVAGMGTDFDGTGPEAGGTGSKGDAGEWKGKAGESLLSEGSNGLSGKPGDSKEKQSENGSGGKENGLVEDGGNITNGGDAQPAEGAIPVPPIVEQPTDEMREKWANEDPIKEIVANVLQAGSVSGLILGEAERSAQEQNGISDGERNQDGKNNGSEEVSGPHHESSGLRQRNGNGKRGVNTAELESQAVQSAGKDLARGEETKEEAGMDLESRNRRREYLQRYRFLWDDEALEEKARRSETLKRLKAQKTKMSRHPTSSADAFDRELKVTCVMLEERIKEMTGRVELAHGCYFRNPDVIESTASFLANGKLPKKATRLGLVN